MSDPEICDYDKQPEYCSIIKNATYWDRLKNADYNSIWGQKKVFLPIFTRDLKQCADYVGEAEPDGDAPVTAYSKIPACKGGGFVCLPWCESNPAPGAARKCSSDLISMDKNPDSPTNDIFTFTIDGVKLEDFDNYSFIDDTSEDKKFVLITPGKEGGKQCQYLDPECAGKGVLGKEGEYCDLANPGDFFVTLCDKNEKCCGHGKCLYNRCRCDVGYTGNCCQCADGYLPLGPNNQCIKRGDEQILCCNRNTAELRTIKKSDCAGDENIIVNSENDCYPKSDYYCMNSDLSCGQYSSRDGWEQRKTEGSRQFDDCQKCFPEGATLCDSTKSCPVREDYEWRGKTKSSYSWIIILGIFLLIILILILLLRCKKSKRF